MPTDATLEALRKVCDERARPAEEGDSVADVPARYVAAPTSTEEASEVLRLAAEHDLRVVARGGGSKLGWGAPPTAVDLVVDTGGIAGVVEHPAGDLVVVVRAGTAVVDLQSSLAGAGQQLALDVPEAAATVGGMVATNTSGPRRLLYGTLRDLLIGVTFVRADGVVAKAGGTVVKNVAGYDFGKLLTGSYGTLGLVTQAAFRLHPLPRVSRVLTLEVPGPVEAGRAVAAMLGSQVVPTAVEVDQPATGPLTVAVLLEGTEAGVAGRAARAADLLGDANEADDVPPWFGAYPFAPDGVGLKLTCEISGLTRLLVAVRRTAERQDVPVDVRGSATGVLYAGMPADTAPDTAAAVLADLRAAATTYGGSVVALTAPAAVRAALDVWGPVPGLDLMVRLKDQLDPEHRLSPGRFVGGI
ncbi:MAG: glycolate oxidase binding subunit [Actinomycetota bacterium]|nr:glycolate oxidase binding subunit [Actinomycetota bacterium]